MDGISVGFRSIYAYLGQFGGLKGAMSFLRGRTGLIRGGEGVFGSLLVGGRA